jgi:Lon-like ATP-dependent protease
MPEWLERGLTDDFARHQIMTRVHKIYEFEFDLGGPDTSSIPISGTLIDQILGQQRAVELVRLAARQHRFLLIVGEPGTGKSMLGQAAAELLSNESPPGDLLALENPADPLLPRIEIVPAGAGQSAVRRARERLRRARQSESFLLYTAQAAAVILGFYYFFRNDPQGSWLYLGAAGLAVVLMSQLRRWLNRRGHRSVPRILVNNAGRTEAPFVDATGSQGGALLGDVRHDPYQSGGSETPPHMLLEAGAIHRAHRGVLYIDEVSTLGLDAQQNLLTAIQRRELPIVGRSPGSSGTMVRSQPAPCDALLILAGNVDDVAHIHPALRSRIRGYGYEIFTRSAMPIDPENTIALVRFVAQEVRRDGKIPHFDAGAVEMVLAEARRRSGRADAFTLRLRELGGLIRAAGDLATRDGAARVTRAHVISARTYALSLEEQIENEANMGEPS